MRDRDQALTAKEFAVLVGISYSTARGWFHSPGFQLVGKQVFWSDFVLWRRAGLKLNETTPAQPSTVPNKRSTIPGLPARAQRILADFK